MRQQWKLIAGVCAVILIVVFALQNVNSVQVTFLVFQAQLPMVLVLLISVLFGLLLGFLSSLTAHMNQRAAGKALQKDREALAQAQSEWDSQQASLKAEQAEALAAKDEEIARLTAALAEANATKAPLVTDASEADEEAETDAFDDELTESGQAIDEAVDEFEASLEDDQDPQVTRG